MPVVISKALGMTHWSDCSQEEELLIANCLLSFPIEIAAFIFIFQALGRGYRTSEEGRRAEQGKGGQG